MEKGKYWLSGFLLLVVLTSSVYFILNDEVRIDIQKTRSIFKVYENGEWIIAGIEYVNVFDGTTKMRAKNRSLETVVGDSMTKVTRIANYKEGISTIEIYTFDHTASKVELFPISHSIQVLNAEGKILQYEVQKLFYTGQTVWNVESPQSFGHKMVVEWEDGNYYSRIYKYKNKDEGKLTVKYRIDSSDYSKNVRLFDPDPWWNVGWEKCRNITVVDNAGISWAYTHPLESNFTDLTFSNANEIRIINASCNQGGSEVGRDIISTGSDWVKVAWVPNESMAYSIYYDNAGVGDSSQSDDSNFAFYSLDNDWDLNNSYYSWQSDNGLRFESYQFNTTLGGTLSGDIILETNGWRCLIDDGIGSDECGDSDILDPVLYIDGNAKKQFGMIDSLTRTETWEVTYNITSWANYPFIKINWSWDYVSGDDTSMYAFMTIGSGHFNATEGSDLSLHEQNFDSNTWNQGTDTIMWNEGYDNMTAMAFEGIGQNTGDSFGVIITYIEMFKAQGTTNDEPGYINDYDANPKIIISIGPYTRRSNTPFDPGATTQRKGEFIVGSISSSTNPVDRWQDYGLIWKNPPTIILGSEEILDIPRIIGLWYGETNVTDSTLNLELGTNVNISANITFGEVCVDIDHPDYGINYTCGNLATSFNFNISWFRKTEFNDSSTVKTISPPYPLNYTGYDGGGYGTSTEFESCANMSLNTSGTLKITIYIWETGAFGWNVSTTNAPRIRIRDVEKNLLEEIIAGDDGDYWDEEFYADKFYPSGEYGICLVKDNASVGNTGFDHADYLVGSPDYIRWPHYELNVTTGEVVSNSFGHPPRLKVESMSQINYIDAHQFDEVRNLSINLTGITNAKDVKIFIGTTLTNSLGFVYNETPTINALNDSATIKNITSDKLETNIVYLKIPKSASISSAYINLSGFPAFYNTSLDEEEAYSFDNSCGKTCSQVSCQNAVDENQYTYLSPNFCGAPGSYNLYENFTNLEDLNNVYFNRRAYTYSTYMPSPIPLGFTLSCFNYSSSSWVSVDTTPVIWTGDAGYHDINGVLMPGGCYINTPLQTKISANQLLGYVEGVAIFTRTGNLTNPFLEVGIVDGDYEWNYTGVFNETFSPIKTDNFNDSINDYLETCTEDSDGFCDVPLYFTSDFVGTIQVSDIEVLYTYNQNPIEINYSIVQNYLDSQTGSVDIPIIISMTEGSLDVSDLRYDYAGGNDTIEILAHDTAYTINISMNITNYYSDWDYSFPSFTDWLEFIPKIPTAKNVTPYGQSTSRPIFNITNYGYGGKESNFSVYLNESYSCVNLTMSSTSSKSDGFIINNTWKDFFIDFSYQESNSLWMWADYNCSFTTWKLWEPGLSLRNCCEDCICSEELT